MPYTQFIAPMPYIQFIAPMPYIQFIAPMPYIQFIAPMPYIQFTAPMPYIQFITPMPSIQPQFNNVLLRRTRGETWKLSNKPLLFHIHVSIGQKVTLTFPLCLWLQGSAIFSY